MAAAPHARASASNLSSSATGVGRGAAVQPIGDAADAHERGEPARQTCNSLGRRLELAAQVGRLALGASQLDNLTPELG